MAKTRRIIRRVRREQPSGFDEQLWPVDVALIVLGSFLIGVDLAYLDFFDTRWYANALTWLIATPVLVIGTMCALRFVSSRLVRRGMQFAMVVSLVIHALFLVSMINVVIFTRMWPDTPQVADAQRREPRVIPEYHPVYSQRQQRQPDFEKPVEAETPEVRPEEMQREQETRPPEPSRPQPVPVPEPERTSRPTVVKRRETSESTPRQSEQPAQMSRQQRQVQPRPDQAVAVPQPAGASPSASRPAPSAASVQRTETARSEPRQQRSVTQPEPQPAARPSPNQLARRQAERSPQTDATATPTMERQQRQPRLTPRTQASSADTSAVAQRTAPDQPAPRNTQANRQATASPRSERQATEPVPDTPVNPASRPQRRQLEANPAPQVAQTPLPMPTRRSRTTSRPDPVPASPTVANRPQPSRATQAQASLQAEATPVERARSSSTAQPRTAAPEPQVDSPAVARTNPTPSARQSSDAPEPTAEAASPAAIARSTTPAAVSSSRAVRAAQAAASLQQSATADIAPTGTATIKQATRADQVARSLGEPAAATSRRTPTSAPNRATNRAQGESSQPAVAAPNSAVARRTTPTRDAPRLAVSAESVATTTAPQRSDNPAPSRQASEVARRPATASESNRTARSLDAPSASPATQLAGSSATRRTESARLPTLDPQGRPSPSPARSVRAADVAASPVPVESPAVAQSAENSGGPSVQPAQTVLNRSRAGTAGIGASPNLDRANPAAESPATLASGSASRRRATQQTEDGPALSPSAPALVSRSRADAARPSAPMRAQPVELATTAGADAPASIAATSSAAVTEAASNVESGAITAASGNVEVDLGATRVVSGGGAGRAAGGGQPELTSSSEAPRLARSGSGARQQMALATPQVAAVAEAPDGAGGGQPAPTELDPAATAAVRTDAGGATPVSGGPSTAAEVGPASDTSTAEAVAATQIERADAAASPGGAAASATAEPDVDEEEEKARQVARRAAGGAPQLAMAAPSVTDVPSAPAPGGGQPESTQLAANASASAVERSADGPAGGAPTRAAPGQEAAAAPAEQPAGGGLVAADQLRRAEASEAPRGPAEPGGGSQSPSRSAVGPQFVASSRAETVTVAGAPESAGEPSGAPLEAQGVQPARLAGGAVAPVGNEPVGAAAGPRTIDVADVAAPGLAPGTRNTSPALEDEDGPSLGDLGPPASPLARADRNGRLSGPTLLAQVEPPGSAASPAGGSMPDMGDLAGGMEEVGPMARRDAGGLAVNMDQVEGPGGVDSAVGLDAGVSNRRAREDSLQVAATPARFARQEVGGTPDFNTSAVVAAQPFQGRMARRPGDTTGGSGGSSGPQTEEAIERGLAFLARYQRPDGSWTLKGFGEDVALSSDTAATGLALLAFQGAGYTHKEYRYADVVSGGIQHLVKHQQENGDLFMPLDEGSNPAVRLYSHAIAAIALCEAYGMTQDPELREPAQKALDFIVASQHEDRGGWRYTPGYGSDTSVTGWMMMALKSGELANLEVPREVYGKINHWLNLAQASTRDRHLYRYNPYAPDTPTQRHGREPSETMTAVGLLMRLYSGWQRDNPNMVRGADYLKQHLPAIGTPRDPRRDTYYWYYATQVMFHMGGEHWETWNNSLHPLLVENQVRQGPLAGSWDPRGRVPDRWAPHAGRLYVTTMNLLSLEVNYRHLPLYEETAGR